MEQPKTLGADDLRREKARVLEAVRTRDIVVGQYTAGNRIPSYVKETGVASGSKTETFVSLTANIQNSRWKGVPFRLKTGKALDAQFAEIIIRFTGACKLFCDPYNNPHENVLVIRIQPDEGVRFLFNLSSGKEIVTESMEHFYSGLGHNTPEAYELLLAEAIRGNQTLFTDWNFVRESWKITDSIRRRTGRLIMYKAGSSGPQW